MIYKLSKFFYSGINKYTSHNEIRKFVLLNILLILTTFLLFIFTSANIIMNKPYELLGVNVLIFFLNLFALYHMRITHSVKLASIIGTMNTFFLFLAIIYLAKAENFTLVWITFFPVFAIFINGYKKGLIISVIFYSLAFLLAYQGIDIWLNGLWNSSSFIRFVAANMGMLFITYFFERSFEAAHIELMKNREIEQQYIEALEEASVKDYLTQLYNRRYLDYLFSKQFQKAKENESYFAFFILDLDNFKLYNDTYGHIEGDHALKKVADVLKKLMRRKADSAFRLGGEEFAGLLMADSQKKIHRSIEQIKNSIEALALEHKESEYGILTASIGVCVIHVFDKEDFDKMYKKADEALYQAKAQGRNCIVGDDTISTL